jgi:hypothetical protein
MRWCLNTGITFPLPSTPASLFVLEITFQIRSTLLRWKKFSCCFPSVSLLVCAIVTTREPCHGISWNLSLGGMLLKSVGTFQVWINSNSNERHFTWRPTYPRFCAHLKPKSLKKYGCKTYLEKKYQRKQNGVFVPNSFYPSFSVSDIIRQEWANAPERLYRAFTS